LYSALLEGKNNLFMSAGDHKIDVQYVAQLARLALSAEEQKKLSGQLENVLEYVGKLGQLDVKAIEPTAHAMPLANVFRKDESRPGFTAAEALKNAPQQMNDLFIVPRVVEE